MLEDRECGDLGGVGGEVVELDGFLFGVVYDDALADG